MSKRIVGSVLPAICAAMSAGCGPSADESLTQDSSQALTHISNARELAGTELTAPFDFFCEPGNARGNSRVAPELEPVQLFDNLYAVGNSETVVHAITTSDGILLIDSGYSDTVESVMLTGLK